METNAPRPAEQTVAPSAEQWQTPETTNEQGKPSSSFASLTPLADSLSKSVAAAAIALYASGFLIVSLHHAKFGFISTDPFRPRILAAGAWFFLLMTVPVAAAFQMRDLGWLQIAENLFYLWSGFTFANIGLFGMFFVYNEPTPKMPMWPGLVFVVVSVAISVAIGMTKTPQKVKAGLSIFLLTLVVSWSFWRWNRGAFDSGALTLWYLGVLSFCLVEIKGFSKGKFQNANNWMITLVMFLSFLFGFAEFYYPRLKASWGGGTPVPATIYFGKDSPIKSGQAVSAHLIEESDQGFYIVAPSEKKAVFVPRSAVNLIYFGENAKDSALLK